MITLAGIGGGVNPPLLLRLVAREPVEVVPFDASFNLSPSVEIFINLSKINKHEFMIPISLTNTCRSCLNFSFGICTSSSAVETFNPSAIL